MYKDIINSCIATGTAEILTLPICTLKTNFQNHQCLNIKRSIIDVTKELYKKGGIRIFYNAATPAFFGQVFSTSSKYTLYRYFNTKTENHIHNRVINGISSGIISSLVTHPIDVVKIHMQMDLYFKFNVLYRGYSKTLSKVVISSALFMPIYDTIKDKSNGIYNISAFECGALSAIISTIIMQPVDYLKTRHIAGLKLYDNTNFKISHYYRGLSLNLMRIVPHFTILMSIIDYLESKY